MLASPPRWKSATLAEGRGKQRIDKLLLRDVLSLGPERTGAQQGGLTGFVVDEAAGDEYGGGEAGGGAAVV